MLWLVQACGLHIMLIKILHNNYASTAVGGGGGGGGEYPAIAHYFNIAESPCMLYSYGYVVLL